MAQSQRILLTKIEDRNLTLISVHGYTYINNYGLLTGRVGEWSLKVTEDSSLDIRTDCRKVNLHQQ